MPFKAPFQRATDMVRNDEQSVYPELWRGLLFGPFDTVFCDRSGFDNHGTLVNIELPADFLE